MSSIKGVLKDGWHPQGNDGEKESWRGDFKGINQVAGWVGKGKSGGSGGSSGSVRSPQPVGRSSRPLSSLKDPSSFAPPPRRGTASSASPAPPPPQRRQTAQDSPGAAGQGRAPPPLPSRADSSGLSATQSPSQYDDDQGDFHTNARPPVAPKPALPPRVPPRNGSSNQQQQSSTPSPPPAYEDNSVPQLNQSAMNRLGNAGVSVGNLGIGRNTSNEGRNTTSPTGQQNSSSRAVNAQNELTSRFAKMNSGSSSQAPVSASTVAAAAPLAQNHVQNQSQRFRSQDQNTPARPQQMQQRSSSSLNSEAAKDANSTNSTDYRQNEHVQAGLRKFSTLDQKYGIKKRINGFIEDQKSPAYSDPNAQQQQQQQQPPPPPQQHPHPTNSPYSVPSQNSSRPDLEALNKRKPPPPPPPRKPNFSTSAHPQDQSSPDCAPPLPLNTKPR